MKTVKAWAGLDDKGRLIEGIFTDRLSIFPKRKMVGSAPAVVVRVEIRELKRRRKK